MMRESRERRGSRRAPAHVRKPVGVLLSLEAEILYLSVSGMTVRLPYAPEMHSRHGFTLLIDSREMDLQGVVRNTAPEDDECGGYHVGIEFVDLSRADEAHLERYVERKLKP